MADKRYTNDDKVEALRKLKANNYNIAKTADELKLNRRTLMKWRDVMGPAVFKDEVKIIPVTKGRRGTGIKSTNTDDAIVAVNDMSEAAFVERSRDLKNKVMDRLLFLVKNNCIKNVKDLVEILKVTHNITEGIKDGGQANNTLIQQVNNFCIQFNKKLNSDEND